MRSETSHLLAGAARSNGGDYPDPEVRERVDILKLVLTIVFLIPSAFSVCILTLSDMVYKVIMLPIIIVSHFYLMLLLEINQLFLIESMIHK